MTYLAIDFGTSNTAAAVLDHGVPRIIPLEGGAETLPTAVFLDYDARRILVGRAAVEALIDGREGRFMRALKSVLGTALMRETRQMLNERMTLIDLVGRFPAEVKARAEAMTGQRFDSALSGRPVHFHDDPRRDAQALDDLRECYAAAGFSHVEFLAEPEAAALSSGAGEGLGLVIDIGGGTTDTSDVEYSDDLPGVGVDLSVNLMFKDSTTIAGDRLVKDIVERVMLPMLGQKFASDKDQKDLYERFFFTRANRDGERAKWSVISRTVIIPMIHHWLRNFSAEDPSTVDWTPVSAGASAEQIDQLNEMARAAGLNSELLDANASLQPDIELIRKTIQDWFMHIADAHARYLAIFECDLVILTGKPSELPEIRELLEKRLPIFPDRILSAKGYFAGDWLPLSRDGHIVDAKLVTALGTAVYRGVRSGLISGWRIRSDIDQTCRVQNYWGRIAGNLKPFLANDILLAPGEKEVTARLLTDSFIGRARFLNHVLPEQVYRLVYTGKQQVLADIRVRRKVTTAEGRHYAMSAEALELVSAKNAQTGASIPLTDIKLQLCTLPRAEEFWQDTGRFEVRWPLALAGED